MLKKFTLSLILSLFVFIASGTYASCSTIYLEKTLSIKLFISLLSFSIATYISFYYKSLKFIHIIILFIFLLYSLIGIGYGPPNSSLLISLLETSSQEALEFLINLNKYHILFFIVFTTIIFMYAKKATNPISNFQFPILFISKFKYFATLIIYILFIFIYCSNGKYSFYRSSKLAIINLNTYKELIYQTDSEIKYNVFHKNNYKKHKYNIMIIGESVRKDYLSLYHYPLNTTPYLNQLSKIVFNNYTSAAPNTVSSLKRTLIINKSNEVIGNNIINLAKAAGYQTTWLSNQGLLGDHDTFISKIAFHADDKHFLKTADYNSTNHDDFELLTLLNNKLKKIKDSVIFIHMIGSHPYTCNRLNNFPRKFNVSSNESLNCYLDTISKLDTFIYKTKNILDKTGESYSIMYFSDHGMDVSESNIRVNNIYKQNYAVPMFIINSDAAETTYIDEKISALNFPALFAHWLGIGSDKIQNINDFRDLKEDNIKVFNWRDFVDFDSLEDQKAIY